MVAELPPVVWPEATCLSVSLNEAKRGGVSLQCISKLRICLLNFQLAGEYPNGVVEAAPQLYIHGAGPKDKYVEIGDPRGLYRLSLGDGKTFDSVCLTI